MHVKGCSCVFFIFSKTLLYLDQIVISYLANANSFVYWKYTISRSLLICRISTWRLLWDVLYVWMHRIFVLQVASDLHRWSSVQTVAIFWTIPDHLGQQTRKRYYDESTFSYLDFPKINAWSSRQSRLTRGKLHRQSPGPFTPSHGKTIRLKWCQIEPQELGVSR